MAPKVTVFIDYQNAHLSGHEIWCQRTDPIHKCLIHPLKLAEQLVAIRTPAGVLESVRVFRGRPDPRKEPLSASRSDRQAWEWEKDPRVTLFRRPLRYPSDWGKPGCIDKAREKGIDVSIAIDMVRMAMKQEYEVGILFSRDTDLVPALELVFDMPGVQTEVATWADASRLRLKYRDLYCHKLNENDFLAARDPNTY